MFLEREAEQVCADAELKQYQDCSSISSASRLLFFANGYAFSEHPAHMSPPIPEPSACARATLH